MNARRGKGFARPIGECAAAAAKPAFKKHGLAETRIIREWAQIVGPELSSACIPHKLAFPRGGSQGGTLTVLAGNGAAAMELHYQEPLILERIAAYFGFGAVTRIQIRQAHLPPPPPPKKAPRARAEGPVSLPHAVEDDSLRAALEGLARSLQS